MNNPNQTTQSGLIGIATVSLFLLAIVMLTVLTGCRTDSTDKAQEVNEKRIDSQAVAISDDAKDEAKKMAEQLVELASMQQTAYHLSQEAAQRATNGQVKAYAQRVLTANTQTTNELNQLAQTMKIVLPTSPADDGRDRIADLQNAKPGVAFDLKYLDELGKVAKKSANVAEDLEDDATTEAVKAYGAKLRTTQKSATDQLKQLKKVIE
jgi:putative membrane protein